MSEFDPEPPLGAKMQVRLKFERYVFFSCFAFMVMVVIAGIFEIKKSQGALESAREDAEAQRNEAAKSRSRADRTRSDAQSQAEALQRKAAVAEGREQQRSRELAAALVQLALLQSDKGPVACAQARALLDDAARMGAPAYI